MARVHWGGPRSLPSQKRGLQTRYENGNLSKEGYITALRRIAQELEDMNTNKIFANPVELGWARSYRRQADELEREETAHVP